MRRDEHAIIDDRPGRYFVTVRNDAGDVRMLLGPYDSHLEALEHVDRGTALAMDSGDPRAAWYAYGTCRQHDDDTRALVPIFERDRLATYITPAHTVSA